MPDVLSALTRLFLASITRSSGCLEARTNRSRVAARPGDESSPDAVQLNCRGPGRTAVGCSVLRSTTNRWVGVTPTPGVSFSSTPEHGRDYHAFGTENNCDPGRSSDKPVRSGPGKTGRRGAGNEGFPFQARRDSCRRRGPPVRSLLLPDRSAGLPARCCWKRRGHLEAYRKRHCFLPRCPAESARFHDRSIPCRPIQVPHPRPWSRASASRMLQRRQRLSSSRSSVFPVRLRPPRRSGFRWNSSPRQPPSTPTPISPPSHARSQGSATRAIVRTSSLNQGLCPNLPIVRTSSLNQGLCPSLRMPRLHTLELAWILVATPRRMQRPRA